MLWRNTYFTCASFFIQQGTWSAVVGLGKSPVTFPNKLSRSRRENISHAHSLWLPDPTSFTLQTLMWQRPKWEGASNWQKKSRCPNMWIHKTYRDDQQPDLEKSARFSGDRTKSQPKSLQQNEGLARKFAAWQKNLKKKYQLASFTECRRKKFRKPEEMINKLHSQPACGKLGQSSFKTCRKERPKVSFWFVGKHNRVAGKTIKLPAGNAWKRSARNAGKRLAGKTCKKTWRRAIGK